MNTITNAINAAQKMIRTFCVINKIHLEENILEIPVKGLTEFFVGRDQSGFNLCLEEVLEDLDGSESMIIVDDLTEKPVILYDENKMNSLEFDDQAQIFVHEHLHYYEALDAYNEGLFGSDNPAAEEAEDEIISLLIFFYSDRTIEEGLQELASRINPHRLLDAYEDKEVARCMLKQLNTIGRCEVLKRLQVR